MRGIPDMAESMPLGELMHRDFVVLDEGDDDSVRQKLHPTGKPIAVIVDHAGEISGVWSGVGRGTAIVASADTPAADIARSGSLLRELRKGAAIVVLSDVHAVGVIPAVRFAEYLNDEQRLRFNTMGEAAVGDTVLAGGNTQPRLVIVCKVCGTRNELREWVEGVTLCANPAPSPHVLVRR
jgi:hypothetical protein